MKPRYESFMATQVSANPKLPKDERMGDVQRQVRSMLAIVLGPEKIQETAEGKKEVVRDNSKGMYDEYANEVGSYRSQDWSYGAYLYRAKMLQHLAQTIRQAPRPDDLTEGQRLELADFLEAFAKQIDDRAIKSLEIAFGDAKSKGVANQWVTELRNELHSYKPLDYPNPEKVSAIEKAEENDRAVVDTDGELPKPVIKAYIATKMGVVKACYQKQLPSNPELSGKVKVTFVISPNGAVAGVRKDSSTLNNGAVEDCVLSLIKTWKFPAAKGGGSTAVVYPFVFAVQ